MNGCAMVARLLSQRCGVWLRQKEGGGGDDGCLCQHGKVLTSTSLGPCPMGGIYRTCREVTSVEREEKAVSCNELFPVLASTACSCRWIGFNCSGNELIPLCNEAQ